MLDIDCKYLEWDSEQLGVNCGLIDLTADQSLPENDMLVRKIREAIRKNAEIEFITIKLPDKFAEAARMLVQSGAKLIDTEITFVYRKNNSEGKAGERGPYNARFCSVTDSTPFLPLAGEMTLSRFFRDPHIPYDRALRLWESSIKNHCEGLADEVLIAYCNDKPCGMVTVSALGPERVGLHIVGVLREYQGNGVGKYMLRKVVERYSERYSIYVETQSDNVSARNVYQQAGFIFNSLKYIIHYWRT